MKVIIAANNNSENHPCPKDDGLSCGCYAAGDYEGDGCDCVDFTID